MVTKTLTIMDDAYHLLVQHKKPDESFSDEIRRLLSSKKKKNLREFFGIIDEAAGTRMLQDLARMRAKEQRLRKR